MSNDPSATESSEAPRHNDPSGPDPPIRILDPAEQPDPPGEDSPTPTLLDRIRGLREDPEDPPPPSLATIVDLDLRQRAIDAWRNAGRLVDAIELYRSWFIHLTIARAIPYGEMIALYQESEICVRNLAALDANIPMFRSHTPDELLKRFQVVPRGPFTNFLQTMRSLATDQEFLKRTRGTIWGAPQIGLEEEVRSFLETLATSPSLAFIRPAGDATRHVVPGPAPVGLPSAAAADPVPAVAIDPPAESATPAPAPRPEAPADGRERVPAAPTINDLVEVVIPLLGDSPMKEGLLRFLAAQPQGEATLEEIAIGVHKAPKATAWNREKTVRRNAERTRDAVNVDGSPLWIQILNKSVHIIMTT
jgi:hypothetical protein